MSRYHLVCLLLLAGSLSAAVETIKPSEAFALLAHCRRHAAARSTPFDFTAEVMLRTEHLVTVAGTFDGRKISLVPAPRNARELGAGDELFTDVHVFDKLVINVSPDHTSIVDMIASGPTGTTRIVFKDGRLFEHVADPYGNTERFDYALADSESYSIVDRTGPGETEELLANPGGGGGGGGSASGGSGDNAESGNTGTEDLILPFGGVVSPTS